MITEKTYKEAKTVVHRYEQQLRQADINCWAFNLNDKVLVKLKEEGFKYWLADLNEYMPEKLGTTMEDLRSRCDKDGYIEFQTWEFMRVFGPTISIGSQPIFETTLRFYKDEMKPCS